MSAGLYGKVAAGASALNVSLSGQASLDGSMTGSVGTQGACIGGNIEAMVSGSGSVDLLVGSIGFNFSKSAVVKLFLSSFPGRNGINTDFYFGSGSPPGCYSKSIPCGD